MSLSCCCKLLILVFARCRATWTSSALLLDAINKPLPHCKRSSLWQQLSQVKNWLTAKKKWNIDEVKASYDSGLASGFIGYAVRSRPSQMWQYTFSAQDKVYWSGQKTVIINSLSADLGIDHVFVSASCNSLSSNTRSTRCFIAKRPFRWNTGMSHLYLSNHVLFSGRLMSTSWRTNCRKTRQTERKTGIYVSGPHL